MLNIVCVKKRVGIGMKCVLSDVSENCHELTFLLRNLHCYILLGSLYVLLHVHRQSDGQSGFYRCSTGIPMCLKQK
jgi:hypothetical protein